MNWFDVLIGGWQVIVRTVVVGVVVYVGVVFVIRVAGK